MTKIDLYESLGMSEYIWGDSFMIDISNFETETYEQMKQLLDWICKEDNKLIVKKWNQLDLVDGKNLLYNRFLYDLAYSDSKNMTEEKARFFTDELFSKLNSEQLKVCTNWFEMKDNFSTWDPITEHTFDCAIALMDNKNLIFTYFISED